MLLSSNRRGRRRDGLDLYKLYSCPRAIYTVGNPQGAFRSTCNSEKSVSTDPDRGIVSSSHETHMAKRAGAT